MNELDNLITITDGDGNEIDFEMLDILAYQGTDYAVLLPLDDESDPPEVTILEVVHADSEEGDDTLRGLDDEVLLQAVFDAFMEKNKDTFDFQ
ncbi:MAG: DUF1292 domain-containing protein [Clostridia bacterium]|nr:DUF1292 domain-containing protein [Clostridia bacterium]